MVIMNIIFFCHWLFCSIFQFLYTIDPRERNPWLQGVCDILKGTIIGLNIWACIEEFYLHDREIAGITTLPYRFLELCQKLHEIPLDEYQNLHKHWAKFDEIT